MTLDAIAIRKAYESGAFAAACLQAGDIFYGATGAAAHHGYGAPYSHGNKPQPLTTIAFREGFLTALRARFPRRVRVDLSGVIVEESAPTPDLPGITSIVHSDY